MSATVALATELAATNAALTTLTTRVTTVEGINKIQSADIALLKTQVAALQGAPIPPPVGLPPPPMVQWQAGMEIGNLSEWSNGPAGDNTGAAISVAIKAADAGIPPRGGLWVMKQSVTGAVGGTRMGRYPEVTALVKTGTAFYDSWWDYFPSKITFGAADMFSIWQIASIDTALSYNPIWTLNFEGTNFTPLLAWSPNDLAGLGPHSGETGKRFYTSTTPIPVGAWTFFEVMVKPAADYTGAIKVWMNTVPLFDLSLVRTRYAGTGDPNATGFMYITHNAYGSGLTPTPAVHYVDDVTISLNRMTYP